MQQYAEDAVQEHIAGYLQPRFFAEKKGRSYAPFSSSISAEERESILRRSMTQSDRYRLMKRAGASADEIEKAFNTPVEMQVFSYEGMIDTVMTPLDSIKYQKSFLRTGFMVMDPHNGLVKAYVGGPDFSNFQYDMAGIGRRQIGSTIKPFFIPWPWKRDLPQRVNFSMHNPPLLLLTAQHGAPATHRPSV